MPSVILSSTTGSRVLHKGHSPSNSGASTPIPSHSDRNSNSIERRSSTTSQSQSSPLSHQQQQPPTSAPADSRKTSKRMRRFPSLLSGGKNKDNDGKQQHKVSQSTSSSPSRRNLSLSGANNIAPDNAPTAGSGQSQSQGHGRSVSLASAPSGLPRPAGAPPAAAALPSSASQPIMPKPAADSPSGIPQAKRVAPPSTAAVSPSPPSTAGGASSTTPSRIPALAASTTSPSSSRSLPADTAQVPAAGSTTAGRFAPSLTESHAKPISDAVTGYRNASTSISSPVTSIQNLSAGNIAPFESESPTKSTAAGAGANIGRRESSGIPRLRNISETSSGNSAAAAVSAATAALGAVAGGTGALTRTSSSNLSGTATPPIAEASTAPVSMYPRTREASGAARPSPGSSISEGGGSRVSTTRQPLPSAPAPAISTQSASDNSVPAMWRTSSYEGSTKAYLSTSASMSRSSSSSSHLSPAAASDARHKTGLIGIHGLEALEKHYLSEEQSDKAAALAADKQSTPHNTPALQHRIRLLRKLVDLRGDRVLHGADLEKIVWLDGTNLHLTTEQELAVSPHASHATARLTLCPSSDGQKR